MSIPNSTQSAVLYEIGKPLLIEELLIPELEAGQVLVKIAFSGICHTQLLEAQGKRGEDHYLPHAMGHEASGTVVSVGPNITQVRPDQNVVVSWIKGEGLNAPGPKYARARDHKLVNAGPVATFTEYAVVSENRCTPISSDVPLRVAALFGCAIPTGAGIIFNQVKPNPQDSIAIFGAGGIGLSTIMAAASAGCENIIAVDISEEKLEFAKKFGAKVGINALEEDAVACIHSQFPGGVDYAIESSGVQSAMEAAFQSIRTQGGQLIIAGNLPANSTIRVDPMQFILGKKICGSVGGNCHLNHDVSRFEELYLKGDFPADSLITQQFPLERVNEALSILHSGTLGRLLLEF